MEQPVSAGIQEESNAFIINVNENAAIQRDARMSLSGSESSESEGEDEGYQHQILVSGITKMIDDSAATISIIDTLERYIYRVPNDLRKLNDEAYTPKAISIGPFHHGDKKLERMEKIKVRYFKRFVERASLDVEKLVWKVKYLEKAIRDSYAETIRVRSRDEFVKMVLVDASFIIVYFLTSEHEEWRDSDDLIVFTTHLTSGLSNTVARDICLLENQLPFFVIEELYKFAFPSPSKVPSFIELTFKCFAFYKIQKMSPRNTNHFVDLLRTFFLPQTLERVDGSVEHLYNASQLHEVGVKFELSSSNCLLDLEFKNGVLKVPRLKFDNSTESIVRNLVAYEQCRYPNDAHLTDYVLMLDFLIDTDRDVDLLVRKGIVVNLLGDSNAVKTLVNSLGTHIMGSTMNSKCFQLCRDLNAFYKVPQHSWKTSFKRDYCSTPWKIDSTTAAVILLGLTFIQTLCSIISLKSI